MMALTWISKSLWIMDGGSFQIFEPLDFGKLYTTYTHMVEGADMLWRCDVVIFDGEKVVAY